VFGIEPKIRIDGLNYRQVKPLTPTAVAI